MSRGFAVVAPVPAARKVLSGALGGAIALLLASCGGGGGGDSTPPPPVVVPPTPDVLAVASGIGVQSSSGQSLLAFRSALRAGATFPVAMTFTVTGATGGATCGAGIDYVVATGAGVTATPGASTTGRLSLASASAERQVNLLLCPGSSSTDRTLTFNWDDGAVTGSASGVLRGSASTTLELSKRLNDTGITTCASLTANGLACPQAGLTGQDGDTGRDANSAVRGQGSFVVAPFQLTTLPGSTCVQDSVTGLVWEGKSIGGLHDAAATYTWRSTAATNGGAIGSANGGVCTGSACDTESYVAAVNFAGKCGFTDWRLPSADELAGIVDSGASAAPTIAAAFANQAATTYWSASPKAGDSAGAWAVDFNSGAVTAQSKATANRVRLVRGF
jgi:hypothetical protein